MKLLHTEFTANGFVHEQLVREGMLAIYRRFKQGGGQEHFEVVTIIDEKYPGHENWSPLGHIFFTIEPARAKFEELKGAVSV